MKRVIVVGAGVTGITVAQALLRRGHEVLVLEKSRGFGGRLATRRVDEARVDHGAPYFTVRDPDFKTALQPLLDRGVISSWADRLHRWDGQTLTADSLTQSERRFAAPDGMASVVRALAEGLDVRRGVTVTGLSSRAGRWELSVEENGASRIELADFVVLAIPAPQARVLVQTAEDAVDPLVRQELERVEFDPCLVVLAGYDADLPPVPWRGIASSAEPLQWIGLESSKRKDSQRTIAVHATGEWSRQNWQLSDQDAIQQLLSAAAAPAGEWVSAPRWAQLKRWRYAKPVLLATGRALLSETNGPPLVCCGDWCQAPRVEGAFQSGRAAADRLIFAGYL